MSNRLFAATRKGLFELRRKGQGDWDIARTSFMGSPVSMMLDDSRDGTLYAALDLGHFGVKLHRSDDGGHSWAEIDRKSVVWGKRVSGRVDLGGSRIIKKKTNIRK